MCLVMIISVFITSGCKKDSMEGITIYSTVYPIEYITETLYGDYSDVYSIYPNEVIELTDKLIADYSNSNLFVYNGLSNEKDYAVKMLNKNKNLIELHEKLFKKLKRVYNEVYEEVTPNYIAIRNEKEENICEVHIYKSKILIITRELKNEEL